MIERIEDWHGKLEGRRHNNSALSLEAVLESQSDSRGGAIPFKALCSDGEVYWIKMLSNRQAALVPATEQIVSRCGRLIQTLVCETAIVGIPGDFDGDVLDNGTVLRMGLAHGSKHVPNAQFDKWFEPQHRERDDNRKRHAGYFALYDWCWGEDMQWLYALDRDWMTYSHDHGHFLPGGPNWDVEKLVENVDKPHEIDPWARGLDDTELQRLAARLKGVQQSELLDVLAGIPASWPVDDPQLEALGWFLFRRASAVADRLLLLANGNAPPF